MKPTVAIIGGGLAGLAMAARLGALGHRVTLCEGAATLGGKMNRWQSSGYTFDTGPSLITMPWVFRETFASAGARLDDYLQLVRLSPVAEYVWPDGTQLTHTTMLPQWLDTIRALEPRDVDGFLRLMKLGAKLYELSSETFLRRAATEPPDWRTFKALRWMPLSRGFGSYERVINDHLRSPHLRQMFMRYPTYVGSSPYLCPATLLVIPYLEFAFGGWFVKGGLYRIVEALGTVARDRGAELLTNSPVDQIQRHNGRVTGIRLADGRTVRADIVVMNGDAGYLPRLLGDDQAELAPAQRSMSGYLALLGTRSDLPGLHHHTVYFSADYRREFDQIMGPPGFADDPTVYVNAPSRSDRSVVPGRGETLFMMANARAESGQWTETMRQAAHERVMARLQASGFPDLAGDIEVQQFWTPMRLEQAYRMPGGAIYGHNSHGWRRAFMRPAGRRREARGLYLVGGSSHPGGGTPTVLLSAKITTELIGKYERA